MKSVYNMEFKKLSIKNFIGDLPNILNDNFEKISLLINSIFNEKTKTLKVKNVEAESKITANTIIANNIIFNDVKGKQVSLGDLLERLEKLEKSK